MITSHFEDDKINSCAHGTDYVSFIEEDIVGATDCKKGGTVKIKMVCSECNAILAETTVEAGDPLPHTEGVAIHESDVNSETEHYFYLNTYCTVCNKLLNEEKVELTKHEKVAATTSTNGTGEYYTDSDENIWVWDEVNAIFIEGSIRILYGGYITAETIKKAPVNEAFKLEFTYYGPDPEQKFIYKSLNENVVVDSDGYVTFTGEINPTSDSDIPNIVQVWSEDGELLLGTIKGRTGLLVTELNAEDIVVFKFAGNRYYGFGSKLNTNNKNNFFNSEIIVEIEDTDIVEIYNMSSNSVLSTDSTGIYLHPKKIGQTTLTLTAKNREGDADDYQKTITVTVVDFGDTLYVPVGSEIILSDYCICPDNYTPKFETVTSNNTSIYTVQKDENDKWTLKGVKVGSSTLYVNGQYAANICVVNPATQFVVPNTKKDKQIIYDNHAKQSYFIPYIIDDAASSSELEFSIVSGTVTGKEEIYCDDSVSSVNVINNLNFNYEDWANAESKYNAGFYLEGFEPGEYQIKAWPVGAKNKEQTINITVIDGISYFALADEYSEFTFEFDADDKISYAVDENGNKLSGFDDTYFDGSRYLVKYSYNESFEVMESEEIYNSCLVVPTEDCSGFKYKIPNISGNALNLDYGERYLCVTDEGYLAYVDYRVQSSSIMSTTAPKVVLVRSYTDDAISVGNTFEWSSEDKSFVLVNGEGEAVNYSEKPINTDEDYYVWTEGEFYSLICIDTDSLSEEERNYYSECFDFDFPENYLTVEGECEPYFCCANEKLYFLMEYGSEDYSDGDSLEGFIHVASAENQIIELTVGESKTFDFIGKTLSTNDSDYKVTFSDNSIVTLENLTITANKVGTTELYVTKEFSVPNEGNSSVTTKTVTKTVIINVTGLSSDNLVLLEDEKLNINAVSDNPEEKIEYESSDESVATVDDEGYVTGVSVGEADITASCGDKEATSHVVIVSVDTLISQNENKGDEGSVEVAVEADEDRVTVTYSSSDENIATVDKDGNITVVSAGTVDITTTVTITNGDVSRDFVTVDTIVCTTHSPATPVQENVVSATCTAEGSYEEVVYCTEEGCDYEFSRTKKTIAKLDHHDDDNDGFCDGCGMVMPGKGGNIVVADGDHYRYQISTDGINFKACGNDTFDCPDGIAYIRVTNSDYKILVNGSEPAKNENGDYVVKVDGGEIITVVNKVVPDKEESLTLFEKIAQFFQNIMKFFQNLFK